MNHIGRRIASGLGVREACHQGVKRGFTPSNSSLRNTLNLLSSFQSSRDLRTARLVHFPRSRCFSTNSSSSESSNPNPHTQSARRTSNWSSFFKFIKNPRVIGAGLLISSISTLASIALNEQIKRYELKKSFEEKIANRSIKGVLIFKDDKLVDADAKIFVFRKNFFGGLSFLGSTFSDAGGRFELGYHWDPRFWETSHQLVLAVVERSLPFSSHGFFYSMDDTVVEQISFSFPVDSMHNDIGTYELTYDDIPTDLTKISPPTANEQPSYLYRLRFVMAAAPEYLKLLYIKIFNPEVTSPEVQSIYDRFWTYKKAPLTPENLIHELLNEVCAIDYVEEGQNVTWSANWEGFMFRDNKFYPNIKVIARKGNLPTDPLQLDRIEIEVIDRCHKETIYAHDTKNISWAIYLARSVFILKGEAELHLAEGHILPHVVGRAFRKYIKDNNPIFKPVIPHIGQMDFINWIGANGIIFGKGSVLETSSLTALSIAKLIIDRMIKKANYIQDIPRNPLNQHHHFAIGSKIHYEILYDFFKEYIRQNRQDIQKCKHQIYRWSESISSKLPAIPRIMDNPENFDEQAEERLTRCLAWLVHKTTFHHWAIHTRQELLTDIQLASLGFRNYALDGQGQLAPHGNTPPRKAIKQLNTARTLLNFKGDAFLKNPYNNIDPVLLQRIVDNLHRYPKYYTDIEEMYMTTQI